MIGNYLNFVFEYLSFSTDYFLHSDIGFYSALSFLFSNAKLLSFYLEEIMYFIFACYKLPFFKNFYWSVIDLQYCVDFYCTLKWLSYTYKYILSHILFHYVLSWDTEYSFLCCIVGLCCLSILYGFLDGSASKESNCNSGDMGSIPGLEKHPGKWSGTHSSVLAWEIP